MDIDKIDVDIIGQARVLFKELDILEEEKLIETLNVLRRILHSYSPFKNEPVDCIEWVKLEDVIANDYNPNSVAPPEMELLRHSILEDGFTQPIVSYKKGNIFEIVDGFHRNRVGRECKMVLKQIKGYLPLSIINQEREDRNDRIASTIRHNRARGKHKVEAMSDIVVELKRRNWSNTRISKELGMDEDEVLRLCQISGLIETFADVEFSKAWESEIFEEDISKVHITDTIFEDENT